MDWILLTNDDGIDAVGLPALATALSRIAPVRIVVPETERSWVGKAITRFGSLAVSTVDREGLEIHTVSGFPADCAQLGINNLFETPPRLVVAGINYGYNHGTAYIQSSGTVGAVFEAGLCGVDGIAFSAGSNRPWPVWRSWAETADSLPMWTRLADIAAELSASAFGLAPTGTSLNINLPETATTTTERRITTVADVGYDHMFEASGAASYAHAYGGGLNPRQSLIGTDLEAAEAGVISISSVHGVGTAPFPDAMRGAFESTRGSDQESGT